jgi:predicted metal-dependent hydrolase
MYGTVKVLDDPQLGSVLFKQNSNAKRYIIRIKQNTVSVTIPSGGNYKLAERFFKKNRDIILQKRNERQADETPQQPDSVLRRQAKEYLPEELERLSKTHGFTYREVKIRKSKTRWGSCSSKGTINLSFYLMLLPQHLIEYVLLHELCHTVEMNHSIAFWTLLDRHTDGKVKELKKEIRQYRIPVK